MAGRRKLESLLDFQRALKQQYGLGEREAYKPWLRVQDVSSRGQSAKIQGIKVPRIHHTLSEHESSFFYLAEFSDSVIDIREQFPLLPLDLSAKIAKLLDVDHPVSPSRELNIITTDFLLTRTDGYKLWYEAISVKPSVDLAMKRVAEKLDIERVWWQLLGVPFHIYVMTESNQIQSNNIQWFSSPLRQGYNQYSKSLINSAKLIIRTGTMLVEDVCDGFVRELGMEHCEALTFLKYLLATKQVIVNLNTPIEETGVMDIKFVSMESLERNYVY